MKKALFLCGTPYHVLGSVLIKTQLDIDSDMILYDAFNNTDLISKNLMKESLFENVKIISRENDMGLPKSIVGRYLYSLINYFILYKFVSRIPVRFEDYSDVFFANDQTIDTVDRYIFCYVKKYHPDIKIHFMDDGLGSYYSYFYQPTKLDYWARRLFVRANTHCVDVDLYLHCPELYTSMNIDSKKRVIKIKKIDDYTKEILKKVFSYVPVMNKDYNTIIFDTVRTEDYNDDGSKKFNEIVLGNINEKTTIVKSHPREKRRYFNLDYFEVEGFPFEILCLFYDFSNYKFISNYSTAVFTPKLLFDQEPTIIFTYRALDKYLLDKRCDREKYVSEIKKLYRDNSKVVVLDE